MDKKLDIKTTGLEDKAADSSHLPYEPTPYSVLDRLAASGYIGPGNTLVDYGCGKGRVCIYLHRLTGCGAIGLEYNRRLHACAEENLRRSGAGEQVRFLCQRAERFDVGGADRFYFFNPFKPELLRPIVARIAASCYENPRRLLLFFYYPTDEYLGWLLAGDGKSAARQLVFLDEIDCRDLFGGSDQSERIMVFELGGEGWPQKITPYRQNG